MSVEPRPIAEILAELLPKYHSNTEKTSQPECVSHPGFDDTVEPFRDLNTIGAISMPSQSRVG